MASAASAPTSSPAPTPPPAPTPAAVQELNLLNPVDTQKVGTDLVDHLNTLADPKINNISQTTRDEIDSILGTTGKDIISSHTPNTGKDIFKLATRLHEPHDDLSTAARKEIHDKILSRLPTKTTDSTGTEYSVANSVNEIKGRILHGKEEKEAAAEKEKNDKEVENKKKEADEKAKHAARTRSDKAVMKMKSVAKDHPKISLAIGGAVTCVAGAIAFLSEAGRTAIGMIPSNVSAAAEKFITNFPIVADYLQTLSTTVHTVSNGIGMNALLGSVAGPVATVLAALPALGYARRKVLQSYGYTMPSYEGRMSALIGNTGHGLRLLTIDAALAPFRFGRFALRKMAKSKALKPTKFGVGAATVGAALAPLTGGTSLAVGLAGYVGGNLYSHNKKADSHGGHGHGDTHDTHEHGGDDHDSD